MTGRWLCSCGQDVNELQVHLIDHAREEARARGDNFVWFDADHGCCAHCRADLPRTDVGRAHHCQAMNRTGSSPTTP